MCWILLAPCYSLYLHNFKDHFPWIHNNYCQYWNWNSIIHGGISLLEMLARAWSKVELLIGHDSWNVSFTFDKWTKNRDQILLKYKDVWMDKNCGAFFTISMDLKVYIKAFSSLSYQIYTQCKSSISQVLSYCSNLFILFIYLFLFIPSFTNNFFNTSWQIHQYLLCIKKITLPHFLFL